MNDLTQFLTGPQFIGFVIMVVRILVVFGAVLLSVPFMVLLERILLARMQHRTGPNRTGLPIIEKFTRNTILGGHLQTIIDGIKLFLKEDFAPAGADRALHALAPLLTIVPAIFILAVVPFGPPVKFTLFGHGYTVPLGVTDLEIGILFYLAVTGVAVYGIVLAGWSSNSKYSLLGGIRSSAQMISYEISLGLSLAGVLLLAGTFDLRALIAQQDGGFWNWNVVKQPVAFFLFMIAGFAETNRLPFDLPEGESELGGGFHTEYSSMKFAMFFMAEYMNMFTFSAMLATLFLGGFTGPVPCPFAAYGLGAAAWGLCWFSAKVFLLVCFMIFIRGTWPRLRYDQLMDLGWKLLLPLALVNMIVTAAVVGCGPALERPGAPVGPALTAVLFVAGAAQLWAFDRILSERRKRVLSRA
jgi:NADH-quinone oxidoreductase subunit H